MAKEVYQALKGMGPTKAPGCDDFPTLFIQRFWHIVGKDVEAFCLGILNEEELVILVMKCISTVSYAVNISGNRDSVFQPTRGLRQRGPLSPCLFLYAGFLKGVKASRRGPAISHLLFTDDCIMFDILKEYERCFGQCVNFNKSTIFFSSNTTEGVKEEISNVIGVRVSTNMERYLGLPNVVGRRKKESFQNLKGKVN
ncbi:reverse transcriptase [Gossypium australe]|uniref:Reverse transcriptase n=1 Tax=Gossypium australe TaxID=47621 RepID=A0A5B6W2J7_9ROSI|nr:reverse transcriptase [Gossypium australe]